MSPSLARIKTVCLFDVTTEKIFVPVLIVADIKFKTMLAGELCAETLSHFLIKHLINIRFLNKKRNAVTHKKPNSKMTFQCQYISMREAHRLKSGTT